MLMDVIGIDLFDQKVGLTCAEARCKSSWISMVLIYWIKM